MQTRLQTGLLDSDMVAQAERILRKCVHCGFCTATCPTYQLLGDELDGPRGRIYQIKRVLEGEAAGAETLLHLDRCLTCRSCQTTCPSGVNYIELLDLGRQHLEQQNLRSTSQRLLRQLLGWLLPRRSRNHTFFRLANAVRPLMPASLKHKTPTIRPLSNYPPAATTGEKTVLLLEGCVQSTLSPNTNAAAELLLSTLGYKVIREQPVSCCGAVNHHLSQQQKTNELIVTNLRNWRALDKQTGLHAIVSTASGCGVMLKDYPRLIQDLPVDAGEYQPVLDKIRDISELFDADSLRQNAPQFSANKAAIAWHAPCTLNHGQKLAGRLFDQLQNLGYTLQQPRDAHLCCGSAGTYSVLQSDLSERLLQDKKDKLLAGQPGLVITANVGCEHHLANAIDGPVLHWAELVANDLSSASTQI
jgi:glycolate oxidase iron-sulfur subunit